MNWYKSYNLQRLTVTSNNWSDQTNTPVKDVADIMYITEQDIARRERITKFRCQGFFDPLCVEINKLLKEEYGDKLDDTTTGVGGETIGEVKASDLYMEGLKPVTPKPLGIKKDEEGRSYVIKDDSFRSYIAKGYYQIKGRTTVPTVTLRFETFWNDEIYCIVNFDTGVKTVQKYYQLKNPFRYAEFIKDYGVLGE